MHIALPDMYFADAEFKSVTDDIVIDFGLPEKNQLIDLIEQIEREIGHANDDYFVRVTLKDSTPYAFAPRRFAYQERIKIREITDDLLERGIIQTSTSPYYARIVPVHKKNGELRLCVDLRPLNARVVKQKYPFPIIEDCLTRLSGKAAFTLLDLKDGFHQIRVHPEDTKFFAFATPNGQFEYKRLPFGLLRSASGVSKASYTSFTTINSRRQSINLYRRYPRCNRYCP